MFIFHFNIVETIGSILPSFTSLHEQTSTGEEEEVEQGWKENEWQFIDGGSERLDVLQKRSKSDGRLNFDPFEETVSTEYIK